MTSLPSKDETSRPKVRAVPTPNPLSMKFFLPLQLTEEGFYYEFSRENAETQSLSSALFARFSELQQVFVMQNFITLTKVAAAKWQELAPQLQDFLTDYLQAGHPLQIKRKPLPTTADSSPTLSIEARVEKILEEYVKPAVARDGGAISLESYEKGLVRVRLRGACSGCPSATFTLKAGVERLLKSMLPEVKAIEAVEEET